VWCGQGRGVGSVFRQLTILSLPDNVLLDIFEFCINEYSSLLTWVWKTLVHVCRRWRYIIFGSPIRLNLRLRCTGRTPVRKSLNVWPELPLVINFYTESELAVDNPEDSLDNLVAALKRCDRVREIAITSPADFLWEEIVTAMEGPFPALTSLHFYSLDDEIVHLPDPFLNGFAPCLQHLALWSFSFPSLPRLLSSTRDLTSLHLYHIPNSGYIPPETMARCLSALPKIESLIIIFESPTAQPNRVPPPPTRFILPALTYLEFEGVSEYLEVLAARMDAPPLDYFRIRFFHQLVFDIPQIVRFFGHLKSFRSSSLDLQINRNESSIFFSSNATRFSHSWDICGKRLDWQVSSLAQICSQILPLCSSVNALTITSRSSPDPDNMDPTLWLQLFQSFPSVQSLTIGVFLEQFIADSLKGLTGESAAEVLPSLQSLTLCWNKSDEVTQQGLQSFIAARQHSGHPVALVRQR
jgi:F-box-like